MKAVNKREIYKLKKLKNGFFNLLYKYEVFYPKY